MNDRANAGDGKNSSVTPAEFERFRSGKGSPEETARVIAALKDSQSRLCKWLEEPKQLFEKAWAWKNTDYRPTRAWWDRPDVPEGKKCYHRVIEYLRIERDAGVLTDDEIAAIVSDPDIEFGTVIKPTSAQYMAIARHMISAVCELHPNLALEARSVISTPRKR